MVGKRRCLPQRILSRAGEPATRFRRRSRWELSRRVSIRPRDQGIVTGLGLASFPGVVDDGQLAVMPPSSDQTAPVQ